MAGFAFDEQPLRRMDIKNGNLPAFHSELLYRLYRYAIAGIPLAFLMFFPTKPVGLASKLSDPNITFFLILRRAPAEQANPGLNLRRRSSSQDTPEPRVAEGADGHGQASTRLWPDGFLTGGAPERRQGCRRLSIRPGRQTF